jgi:methionyl-tRNA synthetase
VSRATTLIVGFGQGRIPQPSSAAAGQGPVVAAWENARQQLQGAMEEFAFQRALGALWEFIAEVNRFVDTTQPWQLAKRSATDGEAGEQLKAVLYALGESLRLLGIVLDPFLPEAAGKIRGALGQTGEPRLADAEWGRLASGTAVRKLSGLFPRVAAGRASGEPPVAAPSTGAIGDAPRVSIEEFRRLDLRVAEVLDAEPVPKSKKLLKLTVKLGDETRTIVAGIAEHYRPETLRSRKIVVVANLAPATLMGVESNGMVLAGSEGETLALLTLDRDLPTGAKVR